MKAQVFWLLTFIVLSGLLLPESAYAQVSYVFGQAQFPTGTLPYSVAVGDFGGDGILDLAVANADSANGNTVSILLGKSDGTFAPKVDYATGAAPYAVIAADFNGDGKLDLAVAEPNNNTISILFGNGDGTFQSHLDLPIGQGPRSLVTGDFNNDGRVDIAVANQTDQTVSILLGNGGGSFTSHVDYPAGLAPVSIAAADFNADGRLDLAVVGSGGAATLQGNGNGTFQSPLSQPVAVSGCLAPFNTVSIVAADFNGDGRPDLAVAGTWGGYCPQDTISVLLGNGDGTFQNAVNYASVRFVSSVTAADFNGDGKPDLVVGSSYGDPQSLSVFISIGDGTFQSHTDYSAGFAPISVATGDFNRDGKLDLVTANDQDNNVAVLLGNGDGTFQPHSDYATGDASQGIVAADFNGDGHVDLATADCNSSTVSALIGTGDGTFRPGLSSATGQCPVQITAADFNGDGKIDLAVANQTDSTVSILLGNGDGTFQAHTDYAVPSYATAIAAADFNRDGRPDLVVLGSYYGVFSILLGNGDGTLQPHIDYDAGTGIGPSALTVGDFNADGTSDLAITDSAYSGSLAIQLGNGDGSFRFAGLYSLPFSPDGVIAGDFNRDGKPDLAVAQGTSQGAVSILLGFGDGSFQATAQFHTNHYPRSVVIADFDGDGILDLAVGGSSTSILLGNGDGTFQTHMDLGLGLYTFTTADFDGDGRPDLATTAGTSLVSVFLNKAAAQRHPAITVSPAQITFPATLINTTSIPATVTVSNPGAATLLISDISTQDPFKILNFSSNITTGIAPNTNGTFDTTFSPTGSGPYSGNVSIMSNAPTSPTVIPLQGEAVLPAPTITSISPLSGTQGTSIPNFTVTGTNFDPAAVLSFSGTGLTPKTPYTNITSTQIVTDLRIDASAPLGVQDVIVTNSDAQKGTLPSGFIVTASGLPSVSLSATAVTFAIQLVSTTGPMKSVTLTNTGTGTLLVTAITVSGAFAFVTRDSSCPYAGGLVGSGASCTIDLSFAPTFAGPTVGTVSVGDNAGDSPQSIALSGTAIFPRVQNLLLASPVSATVPIGQAYAQFNAYKPAPNKYHTGLDILANSGITVAAAADGNVAEVQLNGGGNCNPLTHKGCPDHGYGNTVILSHKLSNNASVFTQYSHMASIDSTLLAAVEAVCGMPNKNNRIICTVTEPVGKGTALGTVGDTAFGGNSGQIHLHFELKNFQTLGTTGNDSGEFGYTKTIPDAAGAKGYRDPVSNLSSATDLPAAMAITIGAQGTTGRVEPGSTYRSPLTFTTGTSVVAIRSAGPSAKCSKGWYLVVSADGFLFQDTSRIGGQIPSAWICMNFIVVP